MVVGVLVDSMYVLFMQRNFEYVLTMCVFDRGQYGHTLFIEEDNFSNL